MPHSEHLDEEALSLLALGEPRPEAERRHAVECDQCRDELTAWTEVVSAAREPLEITPPPHVWANIAAATGVTTVPRPLVASPPARTSRSRTTKPAVPAQRRPRLRVLTAAVAAVALIAGVAIGVGVSRLGGDPAQPVLAQTSLGGLQLAPGASGKADVVETSAGRELDVDVTDLARPEGFYQVWLIDPTVTRMVPVGVLNGDVGHWSLPDDMDLAAYPVVDISSEPLDGNPIHSGKSVLRGTLQL